MGSMLVFYIIVTILKIDLCKPINVFWDPNIKGTCLNEHAIFIADTVMSVVSDLAILAFPVPLLWSLQMPLRKKLRIAVLLGAGGVATATTVIRLVLIVGPLPTDRTVAGVQFKLLGYGPNICLEQSTSVANLFTTVLQKLRSGFSVHAFLPSTSCSSESKKRGLLRRLD